MIALVRKVSNTYAEIKKRVVVHKVKVETIDVRSDPQSKYVNIKIQCILLQVKCTTKLMLYHIRTKKLALSKLSQHTAKLGGDGSITL